MGNRKLETVISEFVLQLVNIPQNVMLFLHNKKVNTNVYLKGRWVT